MKKYIVQRLYNKIVVDRRVFSTLEAAKACFDEKVSELPSFREGKNKIEKFELYDYCGYILYFTDTDNNKCATLDAVYMNWKEVSIYMNRKEVKEGLGK